MRDYGKVHTSFWSSATTRSMSEDGRMLAIYLITSPHSTIAGVFRLPDGYVCEDLQWSEKRVAKGFEELLAKGFSNRCETTKWVWVCKHLEWNPPENPNQRKSAAKVALSIPDECEWKQAFMRVSAEVLAIDPAHFKNPHSTLPEPFLNQEQEQEQEQKKAAPPPSKKSKSESLDLGFALPDWVPPDAWNGYVAMRKKKPMTDRARDLVVAELSRLRDLGHDVGAVLDNSTKNGWTDVYEPKNGGKTSTMNGADRKPWEGAR